MARPERLHVGRGTKLGKARDVVRMHHLQMGEVMAKVVHSVGLSRRLDGVERLTHGAVAQRMEVHLEPFGVEGHDGVVQQRRVDEREPVVLCLASARIEVGRRHRCREVLGNAVLHDLDAGGPEAPGLAGGSTLDQLWYLLETRDRGPTTAHQRRAP